LTRRFEGKRKENFLLDFPTTKNVVSPFFRKEERREDSRRFFLTGNEIRFTSADSFLTGSLEIE
jgi:hypothetical protein